MNDLPDGSPDDRLQLIEEQRRNVQRYIRQRHRQTPPLTTRLTTPNDLKPPQQRPRKGIAKRIW